MFLYVHVTFTHRVVVEKTVFGYIQIPLLGCPTCTRGKYQDQVGELGCKGCVAGRSNEHTDDAVPSLHVDCYDCVKGTFQNELVGAAWRFSAPLIKNFVPQTMCIF